MSAKVLVDTNIWVKFFRFGNPLFAGLLEDNEVLCHPLVLGEISMGNLAERRAVISDLFLLEHVPEATFAEVCHLVESRKLWGKGLQWNDVCILAAAVLADVKVWTLDLRMAEVAKQLGVCWEG